MNELATKRAYSAFISGSATEPFRAPRLQPKPKGKGRKTAKPSEFDRAFNAGLAGFVLGFASYFFTHVSPLSPQEIKRLKAPQGVKKTRRGGKRP